METVNYISKTIGEIVTDDFRTAAIFNKNHIDFCCGGKKILDQACEELGLEANTIKEQLEKIKTLPFNHLSDYKNWKLDFLCDYLVNTHHQFVMDTLPDLLYYTLKIADVHGNRHPELIEVANLFSRINLELLQHLKNEEEVLFPAVKNLLNNNDPPAKEIIKAEISRMTGEHEFAGGAMDQINKLTNHYKLPEDNCNTYKITFNLLEQFEDDLHVHVHLENNILYPNTLKLTI